ncbi:type IX secretion system protein PorG [Flavobacterium sp. WC2509]|uniref:type IX secretion system protein PorG n=1 Tax=Flavobacterium sp. WC2509 TaxID=3461406 RepID=UPI004043A008
MSKIFFSFLCFFTFSTIHAQIHEIGIFAGGSNYIGDTGSTTYIDPNKAAFGILYKWNKSPRHAYRFSYTQSQISGNDHDSKEPGRYNRGYHFTNNIKELSAGLEFNFFDFNLHLERPKFTPYVYSGLSYFMYDNLYVTSGETKKNGTKNSIAIPITLGVKTNISRSFILALETGARYTFTDNIDGSNPSDSSLPKFGNINNNDWYVFTGMTLTYTFGKKPCYCAD